MPALEDHTWARTRRSVISGKGLPQPFVSAGQRAGTKFISSFTPCIPLAMRGIISKSRTHLSRPKASQQRQLDAGVSTGAGMCVDITSGKAGTVLTITYRAPTDQRTPRARPVALAAQEKAIRRNIWQRSVARKATVVDTDGCNG